MDKDVLKRLNSALGPAQPKQPNKKGGPKPASHGQGKKDARGAPQGGHRMTSSQPGNAKKQNHLPVRLSCRTIAIPL